jgi:hypothetical protein
VRRGLVALVLLAGCGESHYGAYFVIKGDAHFDQVELYFGSKIDSSGPGSGDRFASPTFGAQQGLVYDRTFEASDVAAVGATTETTYYLPPTDENQQLGDYVAAVALQGDKPVGMAEYFGFDVPTGEVHEFRLDLTAWNAQEMERWGSSPGCVVWKHPRDQGNLVAVVHKDDRDCDEMMRDADCNDLCNAQVPACAADQTFCSMTGYCALGCTIGGLCGARMCLPASACASGCATQPTLQQRLDCGTGTAADHIEIYADRTDTKVICNPRFSFDPGVPCTDPKIEAKTFSTANTSYTYVVAPDSSSPGSCVLYMMAGTNTAFGDTEQHHLMISFAPAALGPRPTVVVGVQASQNPLGCNIATTGYAVTYPTNRLYNCP